jgi:hypothetical protein
MSRRRLTWWVVATTTSLCLAGVRFAVRAQEASRERPLFYSGTLTDAGELVNGTYKIVLRFFDQESGGNAFCSSETSSSVTRGRFRVDVSNCTADLQQHDDAWLALSFTNLADGAQREIVERVRLAAVPYALASAHAASASVCERVGSLGEEDIQRLISEPDGIGGYSGGDGIKLADRSFSVDSEYVQRRVDRSCEVGSSIREIASDGSVTCEPSPRITGWTPFSPVLTFGPDGKPAVDRIMSSQGAWRRVGDSIEVRETVRFNPDSATTPDTSRVMFQLPKGLRLLEANAPDSYHLGSAILWGAAATVTCYMESNAKTPNAIFIACQGQGAVNWDQLGGTDRQYYISLNYTAQIAGWTTTTPAHED